MLVIASKSHMPWCLFVSEVLLCPSNPLFLLLTLAWFSFLWLLYGIGKRIISSKLIVSCLHFRMVAIWVWLARKSSFDVESRRERLLCPWDTSLSCIFYGMHGLCLAVIGIVTEGACMCVGGCNSILMDCSFQSAWVGGDLLRLCLKLANGSHVICEWLVSRLNWVAIQLWAISWVLGFCAWQIMKYSFFCVVGDVHVQHGFWGDSVFFLGGRFVCLATSRLWRIVVFGVVGGDMFLWIGQQFAGWLCMFCVEISLDNHSHVHIIAKFGFLPMEGLRISFGNAIGAIFGHCGFEVAVVSQGRRVLGLLIASLCATSCV